MKNQIQAIGIFFLFAILLTACANMPSGMGGTNNEKQSSDSPLIGQLTSKLGVSKEQATGGAGALLAYAKQKLSPEDYGKVSSAMPETEGLVKAAPKNSMVDGMQSMLGSGSSDAGGIASLAGSFSQLGLSSDMIGMYLPILLEYASEFGGGSIGSILGGVLK